MSSTAIESVELHPRRSSISKIAEVKDVPTPTVEEKVEEGFSNYLEIDGLGMIVKDEEIGDFDADESPYAEGKSDFIPRITLHCDPFERCKN